MRRPAVTMEGRIFTTSYRVIYGDTDAAGVVYNANYLKLFEIGRTELMRQLGVPYSRIEEQGLVIPVTECYLRFKAPARYDDLLDIETVLAGLRPYSCQFHYRIRHQESGKILAEGFTRHGCVDRQGRLKPFPEILQQQLRTVLPDGGDDSRGQG